MLWVVQAGSAEEAEALRSAPATAADLADAARLPPQLGAERLHRRRLLRAFAARTLEVSTEQVDIERLDSGGQRIVAPRPLFASVAARGDWVAVAISDRAVGADLETRPPEHPLPVNLLHPRERAHLLSLSDAEQAFCFLRFWTAREAYCKAMGRGLPNDLASIEAGDDTDGEAVLLLESGIARAKAAITVADQYVVAVVELRAPG